MDKIGNELKYQRILNNKTLKDVENDTGIKSSSLSRWENNIVLPSIEFCIILADYYDIPLDELIGRDFYKN